MIDKNLNYIKYFLNLIKDFDESTVLNPDLSGIETPNLVTEEFKINKHELIGKIKRWKYGISPTSNV